jgi:hypothetical protein
MILWAHCTAAATMDSALGLGFESKEIVGGLQMTSHWHARLEQGFD